MSFRTYGVEMWTLFNSIKVTCSSCFCEDNIELQGLREAGNSLTSRVIIFIFS